MEGGTGNRRDGCDHHISTHQRTFVRPSPNSLHFAPSLFPWPCKVLPLQSGSLLFSATVSSGYCSSSHHPHIFIVLQSLRPLLYSPSTQPVPGRGTILRCSKVHLRVSVCVVVKVRLPSVPRRPVPSLVSHHLLRPSALALLPVSFPPSSSSSYHSVSLAGPTVLSIAGRSLDLRRRINNLEIFPRSLTPSSASSSLLQNLPPFRTSQFGGQAS